MISLVILAISLVVAQCASLDSDVSINIINGDPAEPHAYPFMVLFRFSDGGNCNGILISTKYVLTSGICMRDNPEDSNTTVELGVNDFSCPEETRVTFRIKRVLVHPLYFSNSTSPTNITIKNNIALVELGNTVGNSDTIRPARLSRSAESYVDKYARTCGWGKNATGRFNDVLLTFENKVISLDACQGLTSEADDTSICVSGDLGQRLGRWDDGAPLIINDMVVGVANHPLDSVSVFTRISPYVDWIQNNSDVRI